MTNILDTVYRLRLKDFQSFRRLKLSPISNGKGKSGDKLLVETLERAHRKQ
jgi:hypothetical protein